MAKPLREVDGELKVTEPQKQDAWEWFALNALPQNLYSPSRKFLNAYLERNKI